MDASLSAMTDAAALDWRMIAVLFGISVAVALYVTERVSMEIVSAGVIAVALVFFEAFPQPDGAQAYGAAEILSGFGNPALATIMALLVIGQGVFRTGAMEGPARSLTKLSEARPLLGMATVFAGVFAVSAVLNNTPVVVVFIPILAAMAGRLDRPTSHVMMPLSFTCILAGMTTLIGSSTNILVSDALMRSGEDPLGFFTQTPIGLVLAGVGLVYVAFVLPRLLPNRGVPQAGGAGSGRHFIAQLEVTPGHPLDGAAPVAGLFPQLPDVTVRTILRGERALLPPFEDDPLRPGDILILAATRRTLSELLGTDGAFLSGFLSSQGAAPARPAGGGPAALVEAVVAPGSRMVGRTIVNSGFYAQTGAVVLGVQRRNRMIRTRLSDVRLESGDVLLVYGSDEALRALREQRDVLPLVSSTTGVPHKEKALVARAVFAGVVIFAASGLLPILHAALLGAVAMVAAGCLNIRQAVRAFDPRIFLLIGAAFAMGGALEATGAAAWIANGIVATFQPFGPVALLSALFLVVALMTNILSNSATAVLFAPIVLQAAAALGLPPEPFVLTLIFAANVSFATPIAYQTNLLVMGPGHYTFRDFLRAGLPLVFVMWIAYTVVAAFVFNL